MSNINIKYKNVFVHIPKCAGTSMEKVYFVGGGGHSSLDVCSKDHRFDEDYLKWTFIRNPFDRIASAYFKHFNIPNSKNDIGIKNNSFKEFIINIEKFIPIDYHYSKDHYKVYDVKKYAPQILPIDYYILSDNTEMDFIGKVENIQEDWKKLCKLLGVKQVKLPHINKTSNKQKYQKLYDNEMKNVIEKTYKYEIKRFY